MSVAENLQSAGYLTVKLAIRPETVAQMMGHFHYFVEHPPEGLCSFDSPIQKGDGGFTAKTGTQGSDHKTFFHYRPLLNEQLKVHNPKLLKNARMRRLLKLSAEVEEECRRHALDLARSLEAELPACAGLKNRIRHSAWSALRLVAYTGYRNEMPNLLARPHTDRAALTFALHESHRGFEVKTPGSELWQHIMPHVNRSIVFGGDALQEISRGAIPALCHRARHLEPGTCVRIPILRSAAVYFAFADQ
jgi:isopenicillin N synthase-like dioxygenase